MTTRIFDEFEIHNRPSVVPPHKINGGSAGRGGDTNPFNATSRARRAREDVVDVDEEGDEEGGG